MKYDTPLKDLFQQLPQNLLKILIGIPAVELLTVEYPTQSIRRPDLVFRLANNAIFHLEIQSDNLTEMPWRLLEYRVLIRKIYKQSPIQQVLYVGNAALNMPNDINEDGLHFDYKLMDIRQIDCQLLLESDALSDNILAILCGLHDETQVIRQILQRTRQLNSIERQEALQKMCDIAGLRPINLQDKLQQEIQKMPISIDYSKTVWYKHAQEQMRESMEQEVRDELLPKMRQEIYNEMRHQVQKEMSQLMYQEIKKEIQSQLQQVEQARQSELLTRQLEKRFGKLPEWIQEKVKTANISQLEEWSLQLMDAEKLEDIFQLH